MTQTDVGLMLSEPLYTVCVYCAFLPPTRQKVPTQSSLALTENKLSARIDFFWIQNRLTHENDGNSADICRSGIVPSEGL